MELKTVSEIGERLEKEVSACVKCGNCFAFCPIFRAVRREEGTMRGKIAALQARLKGRNLPDGAIREGFGLCAGCLSCKANCPNGIDTPLVRVLANRLTARFPTDRVPDWFYGFLENRPNLMLLIFILQSQVFITVFYPFVKTFQKCWFEN